MQRKKLFSVLTIFLSFILFSTFSSQVTYGQTFYKLAEDDNTAGSSSSSSQTGNDDTILIVAGLAAAAIVGYVLYTRANSSEEDSTDNTTASLNRLLETERNSFAHKVNEVKENIPVDISFSIKKPSATIPDRTYSIGLAFRF